MSLPPTASPSHRFCPKLPSALCSLASHRSVLLLSTPLNAAPACPSPSAVVASRISAKKVAARLASPFAASCPAYACAGLPQKPPPGCCSPSTQARIPARSFPSGGGAESKSSADTMKQAHVSRVESDAV